MIAILGLLTTLLLILALLLGIGVGVGLLLEWLLAIERGFAVLIGVVSTAFSVHLLLRILSEGPSLEASEDAEAELPELPEVIMVPPQPWRRRRRKPKK